MAPIPEGVVYATLLMNDGYLPGAMVLGHSLRDRGARCKLVALVTLDHVASETINELRTVYDDVVPVSRTSNKSPANLYVMDRPDLLYTFTKIELWRQTQYKRIVYLDADMVCLRAPNELLTMDTQFAAVPDIGWPDCFNSGLMVLNPNMADYYGLLALAQRGISFDGADQGLLNMHFRDWERLSFAYNCTPSGNYQYVPAYRHFQSSISMVHFIGRDKPWTLGRENKYNSGVYGELLGMWWNTYDRHYRSQKSTYYSAPSPGAPKLVQDYVHGEEAVYAPGYMQIQEQRHHEQKQQEQEQQTQPQQDQQPQHHHHSQAFPPTGQPSPPQVIISGPAGEQDPGVVLEQPMGDGPEQAEQVVQKDYQPTPTAMQRKFSAPHVDWEPSRAPPPVGSRPEAINFPTTTYDMSTDTQLFQPPAKYPDAPRDMWYQVPEKAPEPEKPKPIFPWESNAPKPTRVFAPSREPTPPPPEPEPVPVKESVATSNSSREGSLAGQLIPHESPPPADTWASFQSRTNAWDDMPEIEKYVQSLQPPRRGKIQVLHHSPGGSRSTSGTRRPSMKITDFPTAVERPSLPVTPAPIRRDTIWGEDRLGEGDLPQAEGVPKQEEWVRQFSSYPQPKFPVLLAPLHDLQGVLSWRCQFCGKQNPIAKLEELSRRQSAVMSTPEDLRLETAKEPPVRDMPESASREAAIEAAVKAMTPSRPKAPKPILKEPKIGVITDTEESPGVPRSEVPKKEVEIPAQATTAVVS